MIRTLLLVVALLAGCAAPLPPASVPDRAQLLAGEPIFGDEALPQLPQIDILALDQPMRDFLARHVDRDASRELRLHQLAQAILGQASFGLNYSDATRTAAGTFAARDGNCMSFTNMFVAMARGAGLHARFQQIEIPPDWERRGDYFVLSRHVNVLVDLGDARQKVVDFNTDDFRTSYDREAISDRRAAAHFYNNLGVERMQAGDPRGAFLYMRRAAEADAGFGPVWVNLGALYLRQGATAYAEASYLEALRGHDADLVATSSLARLYEIRGDSERTAYYAALAARHREANPYYRYHEAREAWLAGDYRRALRHLDFAIGRKPEEDSFVFLRALTFTRLGEGPRAEADYARAAALAGVDARDTAAVRAYRERMEAALRGPDR